MEGCIFCKIANGEIPAATLWEDEDFRVILDLGPASKGHALILPKTHAANIYELSDELAGKAMILAKKMAGAMTEALQCDGFNIVQNNGEPAGQTAVSYTHLDVYKRQCIFCMEPGYHKRYRIYLCGDRSYQSENGLL